MRVVLMLGLLSVVAWATNQMWLGKLIFLFLFGCSLWGVGEAVRDVVTGQSTLTDGGRNRLIRKHLESLPPNFNPCYYNLRRRGFSHDECLSRGEPPLRPVDYFEKKFLGLNSKGHRNNGG